MVAFSGSRLVITGEIIYIRAVRQSLRKGSPMKKLLLIIVLLVLVTLVAAMVTKPSVTQEMVEVEIPRESLSPQAPAE